jgi:hypothetical protein
MLTGRPFYLLIHTPVELARPVSLGVYRSSTRYDALFMDYAVAASLARSSGETKYLMSKNEIQRWTPAIPAGPRVQAVAFTIYEHQLA